MKTLLFTEIWKDIPGYIGLYQASTFGRIRSLNYKRTKHTHILKQTKHKNGYYAVGLFKNNTHKTYKVHRLVWETFKGKIPIGYEINHIDENKENNRLENLNLMTHSENINYGNRNTNARINNKNTKKVRQCNLNTGELIKIWSSVSDCNNYGFYSHCVRDCCNGKYKQHKGYKWEWY